MGFVKIVAAVIIVYSALQVGAFGQSKSRFDNACAMYAAFKAAGLSDPKMPEWIADCARHPDKGMCATTKIFVEDKGISSSELVCGAQHAPLGEKSDNSQQALAAAPQRAKGTLSFTQQARTARMTFRFDTDVGVAVTNPSPLILVLKFTSPVDIRSEDIDRHGPLISAARMDPDAMALRMALSQKVKFQATAASGALILELLPE